jgi:5,10-methylenetetrahydrofolate reductase
MNLSFAYLTRLLNAAVAATLLSVTFAAPAQQAVPELQAAQQAVDRADRADADQYAPDLIALARQSLSQAQAAAANRSQQKLAPMLALRAAAEADLARARSEQAATNAQLQQRKNEVAELKRKLDAGAGQ